MSPHIENIAVSFFCLGLAAGIAIGAWLGVRFSKQEGRDNG